MIVFLIIFLDYCPWQSRAVWRSIAFFWWLLFLTAVKHLAVYQGRCCCAIWNMFARVKMQTKHWANNGYLSLPHSSINAPKSPYLNCWKILQCFPVTFLLAWISSWDDSWRKLVRGSKYCCHSSDCCFWNLILCSCGSELGGVCYSSLKLCEKVKICVSFWCLFPSVHFSNMIIPAAPNLPIHCLGFGGKNSKTCRWWGCCFQCPSRGRLWHLLFLCGRVLSESETWSLNGTVLASQMNCNARTTDFLNPSYSSIFMLLAVTKWGCAFINGC